MKWKMLATQSIGIDGCVQTITLEERGSIKRLVFISEIFDAQGVVTKYRRELRKNFPDLRDFLALAEKDTIERGKPNYFMLDLLRAVFYEAEDRELAAEEESNASER